MERASDQFDESAAGGVLVYRDGHDVFRVLAGAPAVLRHVDGRSFVGVIEVVRPPFADLTHVPRWAPRTVPLGAILATGTPQFGSDRTAREAAYV